MIVPLISMLFFNDDYSLAADDHVPALTEPLIPAQQQRQADEPSKLGSSSLASSQATEDGHVQHESLQQSPPGQHAYQAPMLADMHGSQHGEGSHVHRQCMAAPSMNGFHNTSGVDDHQQLSQQTQRHQPPALDVSNTFDAASTSASTSIGDASTAPSDKTAYAAGNGDAPDRTKQYDDSSLAQRRIGHHNGNGVESDRTKHQLENSDACDRSVVTASSHDSRGYSQAQQHGLVPTTEQPFSDSACSSRGCGDWLWCSCCRCCGANTAGPSQFVIPILITTSDFIGSLAAGMCLIMHGVKHKFSVMNWFGCTGAGSGVLRGGCMTNTDAHTKRLHCIKFT